MRYDLYSRYDFVVLRYMLLFSRIILVLLIHRIVQTRYYNILIAMASGPKLSCGRDLCCVPDINVSLEDVLKTGYVVLG